MSPWPQLITPAVQKWIDGDDSVEPYTGYYNSERKKFYKPHHRDEWDFLINDSPRYGLAKGGEGGGKSVLAIIKTLERLRRGMSGVMVSPDLAHFKKSLWPEFKRWCPWHRVIEKQHYRSRPEWEPYKAFTMVFINDFGGYSELQCGGAKESEIGTWEGPNISFVCGDEFRRHKTAIALKTFDGRIRIPGPNNEPPQMFFATTPRYNWLFRYFGPWKDKGVDPRAEFKRNARVITLLTEENEENLEQGFTYNRSMSLTEAEARVLLRAEWEDIEETQAFLPSMTLWDLCQSEYPALTPNEPMVLAADAPEGTNESGDASSFGLVGVTRHPDDNEKVVVRFVMEWKVPHGGILDFAAENGPEWWIRKLCKEFSVVQVTYDAYNLHSMVTKLNKENVAWFNKFSQGAQRLESDKQLLDLIQQRRIVHNGDDALKQHIKNANRKLADDGKRLRIVKREPGLNVDLAVCLSMGCYESLRLNL